MAWIKNTGREGISKKRLLQKSAVSQDGEQFCLDFAERMNSKVFQGAQGVYFSTFTEDESRNENSDSSLYYGEKTNLCTIY